MTEHEPRDNDVVVGIHSAASVLERSPDRVRRVLLAKNWHGKRLHALYELARSQNIKVKPVPRLTLDRIAKGLPHQGIALEVQAFKTRTEIEFEQDCAEWDQPLLLVLDGIQDPRNLGACLRAADGAGVDAVLLGKNRCAPLTEVVHRTSTGVVDSMYLVEVSNIARRLDWLKARGFWLTGAAGDSDTAYSEVDYRGPTAIVVGGEEKGIRQLTAKKCDYIVSIPMYGQASSLNVAVATGVLLYEARRQRG